MQHNYPKSVRNTHINCFGLKIDSRLMLISFGVELYVTFFFVWFLETVSLRFGCLEKPPSPTAKGKGINKYQVISPDTKDVRVD